MFASVSTADPLSPSPDMQKQESTCHYLSEVPKLWFVVPFIDVCPFFFHMGVGCRASDVTLVGLIYVLVLLFFIVACISPL